MYSIFKQTDDQNELRDCRVMFTIRTAGVDNFGFNPKNITHTIDSFLVVSGMRYHREQIDAAEVAAWMSDGANSTKEDYLAQHSYHTVKAMREAGQFINCCNLRVRFNNEITGVYCLRTDIELDSSAVQSMIDQKHEAGTLAAWLQSAKL